MPTGGRTTNTMTEMLTNMIRDIAVAKTLPDADLQFLVEMETAILQKLRSPLDAAAGQMGPGGAPPLPPGPGPGGPMPPGLDQMMPMAPPMDAPVPPPVPGLRAQPPSPSPDELSRLMP